MGLFTKTRQLINYGEGLCEKAKNMQFESDRDAAKVEYHAARLEGAIDEARAATEKAEAACQEMKASWAKLFSKVRP